MALDTSYIKGKYPLPVYNYRVTILDSSAFSGIIGRVLNAVDPNENTVISFSEASGLSQEKESVIYRNGLSFISGFNIMQGLEQPVHLILKKGVTRNGSFLYDWMNIKWGEKFMGKAKREVLIDLCDEEGDPVVRWTLMGALPIKLSAPVFDANRNELAIESMELIAHKLKVEYSL